MRNLFLVVVFTLLSCAGAKATSSPSFKSNGLWLTCNNDADAIYNNAGVVVGWLKDDIIFDMTGKYAIAFINNDDVIAFSKDKKYLGRFHNGYFRDKVGNAVGWIKGAEHGPVTPSPLDRVPPVFAYVLKPMPPALLSTIINIEPVAWSTQSWSEFIR